MKDIQATLRRLDEEITSNRQQIAALQVGIMRLEDTRRVLMGISEADAFAAERRASGIDLLTPGSTAQPQLIVRKIGSDKPRKPGSGKRGGRGGTNEAGEAREAILKVVGKLPMLPKEIGTAIGLPKGENKARKTMWNAIYHLHRTKTLHRTAEGRYFRPAGNGNGGAH